MKGLHKKATFEDMRKQVELVQNIFKESRILTKIYSFGDALEKQGRFFMNYILMVENLLLFIKVSKEGLWMLHLSLLNYFTKHFFAHYQLNYARLTPLYLSDMTKLEEYNKDTWDYLKENFGVGKSEVQFTSISSDQVIEQETKNLKVNGGITGLT